jgi:hypothetical protein
LFPVSCIQAVAVGNNPIPVVPWSQTAVKFKRGTIPPVRGSLPEGCSSRGNNPPLVVPGSLAAIWGGGDNPPRILEPRKPVERSGLFLIKSFSFNDRLC